MIKISILLLLGAVILLAAVRDACLRARWLSNRQRDREWIKSRKLSLVTRLIGCAILSLWSLGAAAQYHTIYLAPTFVYNEGYFDPPTPYETSLSAAFADVISAAGGCHGSYCYSFSNLQPVLPPLPLVLNSMEFHTGITSMKRSATRRGKIAAHTPIGEPYKRALCVRMDPAADTTTRLRRID
jgi:hypothetical protein